MIDLNMYLFIMLSVKWEFWIFKDLTFLTVENIPLTSLGMSSPLFYEILTRRGNFRTYTPHVLTFMLFVPLLFASLSVVFAWLFSGLRIDVLFLWRIQFSSVAQPCPTLCDPMNCSTPGLSHSPTPRVHPNPCPSSQWCQPTISFSVVPFCLNLSQHQGLFKWASFSHQVAKVLEFQLQHQSFQWTPRTDLL